jgi:hypothetical protein
VSAVGEVGRAAPGNARQTSVAAAEAYARRTLFDPAGGLWTLTGAPGRRKLFKELEKHVRRGMLAGEALLIVAKMEQHHGDLPPSLNRAMAVMEARCGEQPGRNERMLKETWARWRAVAPFWAARLALVGPFEVISPPPRPDEEMNELHPLRHAH